MRLFAGPVEVPVRGRTAERPGRDEPASLSDTVSAMHPRLQAGTTRPASPPSCKQRQASLPKAMTPNSHDVNRRRSTPGLRTVCTADSRVHDVHHGASAQRRATPRAERAASAAVPAAGRARVREQPAAGLSGRATVGRLHAAPRRDVSWVKCRSRTANPLSHCYRQQFRTSQSPARSSSVERQSEWRPGSLVARRGEQSGLSV